MPYFHLSSGLRGCYMPDSHSVIYVKTRRELKEIVSDEVGFLGYSYGGSKSDIAATVAAIWRDLKSPRRQYLDFVVPLGNSRGSRPNGVFISHATRSDYLEFLKESDQ